MMVICDNFRVQSVQLKRKRAAGNSAAVLHCVIVARMAKESSLPTSLALCLKQN
jgi:hypothetical protein